MSRLSISTETLEGTASIFTQRKSGMDVRRTSRSLLDNSEACAGKLAAYYALYMSTTLLDLDLSPDTLCSGWMCVVLLLSFYPLRANPRSLEDVLARVMAYVALYLLIDHHLDSPNITREEKQDILQWLSAPLPSECPRKSKILQLIDELDGRDEAPRLTAMVVSSYRSQLNSALSEKEYLHACKDKGGITVVVGVRLTIGALKNVREKDLYRLGYCVQLLDDLVDCSDDRRNDINTACTWRLRKKGNVDGVVWRLLYKSTRLPRELEYHAWGIRCAAIRICARTGNVSPVLRSVLGVGDSKAREECLRLKMERALRRAI